MLKKIKLQLSNTTVMAGSADLDNISVEEIAGLAGSWKTKPGKTLKSGSSTIAYSHNDKFVKCSPSGKLLRSLRKIFQTPRSIRSMKMAEKLKKINIATPTVFCAVREKRGLLPVCDYLVTEMLDTTKISFANRCKNLFTEKQDQLFSACALLLKNMHKNHIIHGDASMRNFYFDQDMHIGVIDLDGCRTVPFFLQTKAFFKEHARFLSSFIICSGLSEEPEDVEVICKKYLEEYYNDTSLSSKLLSLTMRYLKRTKRM